jgi:hypothetical protein
VLLDDPVGVAALMDYYTGYYEIARKHDAGFIFETPTWRANRDWGERLGYDQARLADVNRRWSEVIAEMRAASAGEGVPVVLSGNIGPRGDSYVPGEQMSADEAADSTGGCRRANRLARRSTRSTRRRAAPRRTSWSTARTRRTSRTS